MTDENDDGSNLLPPIDQLEIEMVAALRTQANDKKAPIAARVAAAKAVLDWAKEQGTGNGKDGEPDPSQMDLDAINAELSRL